MALPPPRPGVPGCLSLGEAGVNHPPFFPIFFRPGAVRREG